MRRPGKVLWGCGGTSRAGEWIWPQIINRIHLMMEVKRATKNLKEIDFDLRAQSLSLGNQIQFHVVGKAKILG